MEKDIAEEILALPEEKQKARFDRVPEDKKPNVLVWLRKLSGTGGWGSKGFVLMSVTDDESGKSDAIAYVKRQGFTSKDVSIKRDNGIICVVRK